jgi:membrane-associated phospholipid phosphatase
MPGRPAEPDHQEHPLAAIVRGNAGRLLLVFLGVLLPVWLFIELADEVHELEAMFFDERLLHWFGGQAGPGLDRFFLLASELGYAWGVIPADVGLCLYLLWRRRRREAVFSMLATAGSALLNVLAKHVFQRQRPALWESIAPESTFSFPSGHAMGSMTLAAVLVLLAWPTRWRWPVAVAALAFTLVVGISRLYLGVHWPSDVLGGWAAGLAWVSGVYLVLFRARDRSRHRPPWSVDD